MTEKDRECKALKEKWKERGLIQKASVPRTLTHEAFSESMKSITVLQRYTNVAVISLSWLCSSLDASGGLVFADID